MAEWIYEAGIGEARAALIDSGHILAAEIEPDDAGPFVGSVLAARLVERAQAGRAATVELAAGGPALLAAVPPGISEGRSLLVEVVREALPERGRPKQPRVRAADLGTPERAGDDLLARIGATGIPVRRLQPHEPDLLEAAGWSELLDQATHGEIDFPGGQLRMAVTPAMTLFDIDGAPPAEPLATAGIVATAHALSRFAIGGSIGIDLPGLPDKAARQRVVAAFDAVLPQPFERTAINGFGFLQIVRRRPRASLPERIAADPVGAEVRALLRRIEREPPGGGEAVHRVAHSLRTRLDARPNWTASLAQRTGRSHRFEDAR